MEKDHPIDRLLERAAPVDPGAKPPGACLDAELLAAWTAGGLTSVERAAAEAHAADCDRCLHVLAAIAATSPPPSEAAHRSWFSVRWLVPLTAAGVALTAWVVVQDRPSPTALPTAAPPAAEARRVPEATAKAEPVTSPAANAQARQKKSAPPQEPLEKAKDSRRLADKADTQARAARDRAAPAPATVPPTAPSLARPEALAERVQSQAAAFAAPATAVIQSPDPTVQWRISGTTVERSTDSGLTWRPQPTGTSSQLLAGSSPAPTVCWIVGRTGVVLLTVDGESWRRLEFPNPSLDLVAVTASDAMTATVTTADGRRYQTTDGGRTWPEVR